MNIKAIIFSGLHELFQRIPISVVQRFFPSKIAFYGHLLGDEGHEVNNFYRYPSFSELEWLICFAKKNQYDFVSVQEYCASDKKKKILLTFDDGFKEIRDNVFPVLSLKGIPFGIFILVDPIEYPDKEIRLFSEGPQSGRINFLNKIDLQYLKTQKVHIGFHTRSHINLKASIENNRLQEVDEQIVDPANYSDILSFPYAFAFPWSAPDKLEYVSAILQERGYQFVFDTKGYFEESKKCIYRIPMDVEKNINCINCFEYNLKKYLFVNIFRRGFKNK